MNERAAVSGDERTAELRLRVALALTRKFEPSQAYALLSEFGSLRSAVAEKDARLTELKGVTVPKLKAWRSALSANCTDSEIERCDKSGIQLLLIEDEAYPQLLRSIADPPLALWMRGAVLETDALALAIVGSRNCDIYGQKQAERFARECGERGITVVSGLARGIDTHAHRTALASNGRTLAVIGSGLAALYPPENVALSQQVAASGALLSEFPLDCPAHPQNFPRRNRLISGLSLGVLVAQASTRSGSLITARLAGEQGREVFAIPGKIDSNVNAGCHALIRDGAVLVESFDDILREIPALGHLQIEQPPQLVSASPGARTSGQSADATLARKSAQDQSSAASAAEKPPTIPGGTSAEQRLFALIPDSDPLTIDELVSASGLAAAQVAAALTTLELRGMVRRFPGGNFVRT